MKSENRCIAGVLVGISTAIFGLSERSLAVPVTPVLVQGQSVPGDPAFGFFAPGSSLSGLSNDRKVTTWNSWNGAGVFPYNGQFMWQNGVLTDVLRSNDVANAPGIGQPVVQTQPGIVDDNGNIAVPASFGVDQDDVNFFGPSRAGLAFVNRVGGANAPGNAQPWQPFVNVVANNNGQMAFYGRVGNTDLGLWRGTNSANLVRLVQDNVTLIPGTASPVTDVSFETPMVANTGRSLFDVRYGPGSTEYAVLVGTSDANLQVVARTHNIDVPGLPPGTKFDTVHKTSLNNAGHVVIEGSWNDPAQRGLFTTARGLLEPVMLGGITPVPGKPGEIFDGYGGVGNVQFSGNDRIFFQGGTAVDFSVGLFKWDNGVLSNMVLDGDAAPGTASTFKTFSSIHTDAAGDLMFLAELADGHKGLWYIPAGSSTPILQLLSGDLIDIFGNGTDIRPINEFAMIITGGGPQTGANRLLNDNGDFVVRLEFLADVNTRDTIGLYIGTVAVPEPAAGFLVLGLLGMGRRRRA